LHRSLSLVLPVSNAGKALAENIQQLCDALSDLTDWFEVLLLDEGTSEHTSDIAHELAVEYPQVRILRVGFGSEAASTVESALNQARGEVVWIQHPHEKFRPSDLRRFWSSDWTPRESSDTLVG
jgi:hypothetical protein